MQDYDIIDRKHTTTSSVQTVLAVLALLPIIAVASHLNPALVPWGKRLYHEAILTAILCPGVYALLVGLAFPVISAIRGEMSRRGLLVTLIIFGVAALCLLPAYRLPWFFEAPQPSGSTRWMGYLQCVSFYATFTGYATGFSIGAVWALFLKTSVSPASEDGASQ